MACVECHLRSGEGSEKKSYSLKSLTGESEGDDDGPSSVCALQAELNAMSQKNQHTRARTHTYTHTHACTQFTKEPGSRSLLQEFDAASLFDQIESALQDGWMGFMRDFEQRLRETATSAWSSDNSMMDQLQSAPSEEGRAENERDKQQNQGSSITDAAEDLGDTFRDIGEASLETVRDGVGSVLGTIGSGVSDAQETVAPGN
eukprot:1146637-Pelagomonas_calceolata.AAC.1